MLVLDIALVHRRRNDFSLGEQELVKKKQDNQIQNIT